MTRYLTLFLGAFALVMAGCDASGPVGADESASTDFANARPTYDGAGYCGDTDPATGAGDFDYCVDLVAGQDTKVGEVFYKYDGTTFTIRYETYPGVCLTEYHFGAYQTWGDIPFTKQGNIPPGRLAIGGTLSGCTTEYERSYNVALSEPFFAVAHGVAVGSSTGGVDEDCPVIVGIGFGGANRDSPIWGDIYGVNPNTGANEFYFATGLGGVPGPSVPVQAYPNGIAFDGQAYFYADAAQRFYRWATGAGSQSQVGTLGFLDAGATIDPATRTYYYMEQSAPGNSGDDVIFARNLDTGVESVVCSDFMDPDGQYDLEFGDLAFHKETGLLYVSTYLDREPSTVADGVTRFFSIDPNTCAYTLIRERQGDEKLQLAFGTDGVLYGHSTGNTPTSADGAFYAVNPANGDRTPLGSFNNANGVLLQFNDLAPGFESCEVPGVDVNDTVRGFGQRETPGSQWGWIFEFGANGD